MNKVEKESRRDLLKKIGKTAAFVIPTMVTFSISSLAVKPSSNNGNSYGNNNPDQNHHDTHNPHDGWDDIGWKRHKH